MNGHTLTHHDVCWGAIIAGALVSCAVTLFLLALFVGGGLTAISPWEGEGVSSTTVSVLAGIGMLAAAIVASGLGGYVTGRMRHAWEDVHDNERYFRDSAHGLVTWALGTLIVATVLAGAATHIVAGASAGSIPAAGAAAAQSASRPGDRYVDALLRSDNPAALQRSAAGDQETTRGELTRIIAPAMTRGGDVAAADRAYAARIVAARTGLSQADAEQRVSATIAQAKEAADKARKAARNAAMWLAASLLAGAFAAMLAAIEGGKLRNTRWYEAGVTTTTVLRS